MGDEQNKPTEETGGSLWTNSPSEAESQFEGVEASEFSADAIRAASFDEKALKKRLEPYKRKVSKKTLYKVLK